MLFKGKEMKTKPLITVGIPNYNYGQYIDATINSVLSQDYDNLEILIYDDGSTDNSVDLIGKKFGTQVKIIEGKINKGLGVARNCLIKYAKGEYILFLDSDDLLAENAIRILADSIYDNDAVMGKVTSFIDDSKIIPKRHIYINDTIDKLKQRLDILTLAQLPVAWNRLMSTKFLRENNIRFSEYRINEDALFGYTFAFARPKIQFIDNIILKIRQHAGSLQSLSKEFDFKIREFINVTNELNTFLRTQNIYIRLRLVGNYLVYKLLYHKNNKKMFDTILKFKRSIPLVDRTIIVVKLLLLTKNIKFLKIL